MVSSTGCISPRLSESPQQLPPLQSPRTPTNGNCSPFEPRRRENETAERLRSVSSRVVARKDRSPTEEAYFMRAHNDVEALLTSVAELSGVKLAPIYCVNGSQPDEFGKLPQVVTVFPVSWSPRTAKTVRTLSPLNCTPFDPTVV